MDESQLVAILDALIHGNVIGAEQELSRAKQTIWEKAEAARKKQDESENDPLEPHRVRRG